MKDSAGILEKVVNLYFEKVFLIPVEADTAEIFLL
jgi:hypothetical protein